MTATVRSCSICGTFVKIEGDDREGTHYFVPVTKNDPAVLVTLRERFNEIATLRAILREIALWCDQAKTPAEEHRALRQISGLAHAHGYTQDGVPVVGVDDRERP